MKAWDKTVEDVMKNISTLAYSTEMMEEKCALYSSDSEILHLKDEVKKYKIMTERANADDIAAAIDCYLGDKTYDVSGLYRTHGIAYAIHKYIMGENK